MKFPLQFLFCACLLGAFTYGIHLFSQDDEDTSSSTKNVMQDGTIILPDTLLDSEGNDISIDEIKGKYVGLYFSASWCGPCRSFTPKLIKFKDQHKEEFEVILIGSDGSPKAQKNYMKKYKMPWLALANQSDAAREISSSLKVEFIPFLVILDPKGKVITKNGKNDVVRLGQSALSTWKEIEE